MNDQSVTLKSLTRRPPFNNTCGERCICGEGKESNYKILKIKVNYQSHKNECSGKETWKAQAREIVCGHMCPRVCLRFQREDLK